MAKNSGKADRNQRRAVVEQMRKQQERKERMRGLAILGVAGVIVVGLLAAALVPFLQDRARKSELAGTPIEQIGVSRTAAKCNPVKTEAASGSGVHREPGTPIAYPTSPPAFGDHWGNFLQGPEIRNFYSVADRPPLERMVHSLEHGHTILWYDDTVKPGTAAYEDIQSMAEKFSAEDYFMAAPWTSEDGKPFPGGKHIALTHWTGPEKQEGIWEYCGAPSGTVAKDFMEKYDKMNAPEPGAA